MSTERAALRLNDRLAAHDSPAAQLQWLKRHRLLGPIELLHQRGLVSDDLDRLALTVLDQTLVVGRQQLDEEARVLQRLSEAQVRVLVLKGVRVAYSVYPHPDQRWRSDLDLLADPSSLEDVRAQLSELGYQRRWAVPGGTPTEQEVWSRTGNCEGPEIDLHWRLRNHPLLRDRFDFQEQWEQRQSIAMGNAQFQGQSDPHALLSAVMHWFDNLYGKPRPLGWLLDMDLLWQGMSESDQRFTIELAIEKGIAGLLAANLIQCQGLLGTAVDRRSLADLQQAAAHEKSARLIELDGKAARQYWHAVRSESGVRGAVQRLWAGLFPPADYLRSRYPDQAHRALPRLYVKRILDRLQSVYGRRYD
ncbi:MAG: nucleotidyltransferase family protein [Pseudomonadota bacterium]